MSEVTLPSSRVLTLKIPRMDAWFSKYAIWKWHAGSRTVDMHRRVVANRSSQDAALTIGTAALRNWFGLGSSASGRFGLSVPDRTASLLMKPQATMSGRDLARNGIYGGSSVLERPQRGVRGNGTGDRVTVLVTDLSAIAGPVAVLQSPFYGVSPP